MGRGRCTCMARATSRAARGLPAELILHEVLPLIHGFKGGLLQEGGLYTEVKAIFEAVAAGRASLARPRVGADDGRLCEDGPVPAAYFRGKQFFPRRRRKMN